MFANNDTALVGGIGTATVLHDESVSSERQGVRVIVAATGILKGTGVPGTAVTDEQVAYIRGLIETTGAEFEKLVLRGRHLTQLSREVRDGGMLSAPKAMGAKLIDGIQSFDETFAGLLQSTKGAK